MLNALFLVFFQPLYSVLVHFITYFFLEVLFQSQSIGSFLGFDFFLKLFLKPDELILVQLKEDRVVTGCHC